ncbi:MAG: hypothetical protein V1753_07185 [Pseudomonadota bacterium]
MYDLVDEVKETHVPVQIVGKKVTAQVQTGAYHRACKYGNGINE